MKKNTKKGFTLVELLVVIAILAILATVSVVGYTAFINKAHDSNAATELSTITRQIDSEAMAHGFKVYAVSDNAVTTTVSFTLYKTNAGYFTDAAGTTKLTSAQVTILKSYLGAHTDFSQAGTFNSSLGVITLTTSQQGTATWTIDSSIAE